MSLNTRKIKHHFDCFNFRLPVTTETATQQEKIVLNKSVTQLARENSFKQVSNSQEKISLNKSVTV